jgi:thymidine kinase
MDILESRGLNANACFATSQPTVLIDAIDRKHGTCVSLCFTIDEARMFASHLHTEITRCAEQLAKQGRLGGH